MKRATTTFLAVSAAALALALGGCDGERSDPSAMVMQPGAATQPATRPGDGADPATQPAEDGTPVPVYISIDGEPYEFPPARLWLKRTGSRVRARLLSDDPPEALQRDWSGDSFYFEMDMELADDAEGSGSVTGEVTAQELAAAEWIFRTDSTERADTRSGIFLGGRSHLQPISVSVLFDPLPDGKTVMVTLVGVFADFDQTRPDEMTARRQVRVQAALPADAINF